MTHSPTNFPPTLRQRGRSFCALWALCLVTGFVVAFQLQPDARGLGTHEKLGLPPCLFPDQFNIPCPACGMTTSLSHFVRGELLRSSQTNLAGLYLGVISLIHIPIAIWIACTGRVGTYRLDSLLLWSFAFVNVVALLQWIVRLCISP